MKHCHYKKDVSHLQTIDVYRVLQLFDVTDPCLQHACKKILCAGQRGSKSQAQDIQEAIDTLHRYQEMKKEDGHVREDRNTTISTEVSTVEAQAAHETSRDRCAPAPDQHGQAGQRNEFGREAWQVNATRQLAVRILIKEIIELTRKMGDLERWDDLAAHQARADRDQRIETLISMVGE